VYNCLKVCTALIEASNEEKVKELANRILLKLDTPEDVILIT